MRTVLFHSPALERSDLRQASRPPWALCTGPSVTLTPLSPCSSLRLAELPLVWDHSFPPLPLGTHPFTPSPAVLGATGPPAAPLDSI